MQVGTNLTYIPFLRSIPIRKDRYDEQNSKKKCLEDPAFNSNNTHPEVDISKIDKSFRK